MTEKYETIDNRLIDVGCREDQYALAAYVFSLMNSNRMDYVTTTLDIISNTFYCGYGNRSRRYEEFKNAFVRLEEYEIGNDESNPYEFYTTALYPENFLDIKSEHEVIKYEVTKFNFVNGFTMMTYNEYEYLIGCIRETNTSVSSKVKKVDSVKVLALYLYLKKWIGIFKAYKQETYMAFASLGPNVSMSKNTAGKYCELLQTYKMIKMKKGNWKNGEATVYELDDSWTLEFKCMKELTIAEEFRGEKVYAASYIPGENEYFYNSEFISAQKTAIAISKASLDLTNNSVDLLIEKHNKTVRYIEEMSKCLSISNLPQSDMYVLTKSKAVADDYIIRTEAELTKRNVSIAKVATNETS